jgi:hypothetical protein
LEIKYSLGWSENQGNLTATPVSKKTPFLLIRSLLNGFYIFRFLPEIFAHPIIGSLKRSPQRQGIFSRALHAITGGINGLTGNIGTPYGCAFGSFATRQTGEKNRQAED